MDCSQICLTLRQQVQTSADIAVNETSCLLIDGQALVILLGKPSGINPFGDFANIFTVTGKRQ